MPDADHTSSSRTTSSHTTSKFDQLDEVEEGRDLPGKEDVEEEEEEEVEEEENEDVNISADGVNLNRLVMQHIASVCA
jgi:hypothetical protein